jgi:hypothetical protein
MRLIANKSDIVTVHLQRKIQIELPSLRAKGSGGIYNTKDGEGHRGAHELTPRLINDSAIGIMQTMTTKSFPTQISVLGLR